MLCLSWTCLSNMALLLNIFLLLVQNLYVHTLRPSNNEILSHSHRHSGFYTFFLKLKYRCSDAVNVLCHFLCVRPTAVVSRGATQQLFKGNVCAGNSLAAKASSWRDFVFVSDVTCQTGSRGERALALVTRKLLQSLHNTTIKKNNHVSATKILVCKNKKKALKTTTRTISGRLWILFCIFEWEHDNTSHVVTWRWTDLPMLFSHVGDVVFAVLVPAVARHTLPAWGRLHPLLFHTLFLPILPFLSFRALRGGLETWGGGGSSWTWRKLLCRCRSFVALQEKRRHRRHCKRLKVCSISAVVGHCRRNLFKLSGSIASA